MEDEDDKTPLNFDRFAKNETFPIHADLQDSNADLNSEKPGGIFTKDYGYDEQALDIEMAARSELPSSDDDEPEDGYGEPKVNGFYNTASRKRIVYKMAEYKRQV